MGLPMAIALSQARASSPSIFKYVVKSKHPVHSNFMQVISGGVFQAEHLNELLFGGKKRDIDINQSS
jgi:hypothetical protein